jgi:putative addiction module component (TIGR02574 family)
MTVTLEQFGIERLSAEQRLELIELLWDSLPEDTAFAPPEWHIQELERRLQTPAELNQMELWDDVLARLMSKS